MKVIEADKIDDLEAEIEKMKLKVVAYQKEIEDFERSLNILVQHGGNKVPIL